MPAALPLLALAAIGLFVLAGKKPAGGSGAPGTLGDGTTPPKKPGKTGTPGTPGTPPAGALETKTYVLTAKDTPNSIANTFLTQPSKLAALNPDLQWKDFHIKVPESFSGRRNNTLEEVSHPVKFTLTGRINGDEWPVYYTAADGGGYFYFPDGTDGIGRSTDSRFGRIYSEGGTWNHYVIGWGPGVTITVPGAPDDV